MQTIDWILFITPVVLMIGLAVYTQRFVRGVADFLAAGRCAGRYMLCNAKGEAASGLANTMGKFELIMVSGFTLAFWDQLTVPILMVISITGFVIYRYRETRAMTVSQFLEMRYSRGFRIFMGALAFVAGMFNYGIFPAVSARFFVYFLGLPQVLHAGAWTIPTFVPLMAVAMSCSVTLLLFGGQISLMVTDCVEGIISHLVYLIIIFAIFMTVSWSQIVKVATELPHNKSMINPFDAWDVADFNFWFVVMNLILTIYGTMAFQTGNGYYAAALTPHESRMSGILGHWRTYARSVMLLIVTLSAVTFMRHPDFAGSSKAAKTVLAAVPETQIRKQVTIPVALHYLLPTGIKGLFCGIMVMGLMASDVTHIGTWSGIFVQDVVLPLRKQPPSPREHIWWLRCSIAMVAVSAFLFSALFRQTQYITIWMNVSAGVFMAGAGATIIGGLYWRRATTTAAWACMIVGAGLSLLSISLNEWWKPVIHAVASLTGRHLPEVYPIGGELSLFICSSVAAGIYVLLSLIAPYHSFNLKRMLHRDGCEPEDHVIPPSSERRSLISRLFRFDEHFTQKDKWVTVLVLGWPLALAFINVGICAWTICVHPMSSSWWANYWHIVAVAIPLAITTASLVWFTIGTVGDLRLFFRILRTAERDARDNGQVTRADHEALAGEEVGELVASD